MGPSHKLTTEVELLRTNLGNLFKSIDGIPLWELLKGITTLQDVALVENSLKVANSMATQIQTSLTTIAQVAQQINEKGAAGNR